MICERKTVKFVATAARFAREKSEPRLLRSCGVPPQKFGGETPPLRQAGNRLALSRQPWSTVAVFALSFGEITHRIVGGIFVELAESGVIEAGPDEKLAG